MIFGIRSSAMGTTAPGSRSWLRELQLDERVRFTGFVNRASSWTSMRTRT